MTQQRLENMRRDNKHATLKTQQRWTMELLAEIARLREVIEDAPPPECEYPYSCKSAGGHTEDCNVHEFCEWKRNALEGK